MVQNGYMNFMYYIFSCPKLLEIKKGVKCD